MIPKDIIMKQLKNYPMLKEDYLAQVEDLQFYGTPTIDYIIRYDIDAAD